MTARLLLVATLAWATFQSIGLAQVGRRTGRPLNPPRNNSGLGLGYGEVRGRPTGIGYGLPPSSAAAGAGPMEKLWHSEWGEAEEIYFHAGGAALSQQAELTFHGDGNSGIYWGITSPQWSVDDAARASQLEFQETGFGRPRGDALPLNVVYELSQDGGRSWMPGQWTGASDGSSWGYWWLINGGNSGKATWILRVTTLPDDRQSAGRYALIAEMATRPVL